MSKKKRAKNNKSSNKNMMWITALTVLAVAAGVFYFATRPAASSDAVFRNVTVKDLKNASEPDKIILDVRTQGEYNEGHVDGAVLLPVQELEQRYSELPKDKPIYVMCHSGNRSLVASEILEKNGFKDIRNVQGGILAWQRAGYPVVK